MDEWGHTFFLEVLVDLAWVVETGFPFECDAPVLYEPQDHVLHILIESWDLQDGDEVVHEFTRGHFREEQVSTVLHTDIAELLYMI